MRSPRPQLKSTALRFIRPTLGGVSALSAAGIDRSKYMDLTGADPRRGTAQLMAQFGAYLGKEDKARSFSVLRAWTSRRAWGVCSKADAAPTPRDEVRAFAAASPSWLASFAGTARLGNGDRSAPVELGTKLVRCPDAEHGCLSRVRHPVSDADHHVEAAKRGSTSPGRNLHFLQVSFCINRGRNGMSEQLVDVQMTSEFQFAVDPGNNVRHSGP